MVGLAPVPLICRGFCQARRGVPLRATAELLPNRLDVRCTHGSLQGCPSVSAKPNRGVGQFTKLGFERIEEAKGVA